MMLLYCRHNRIPGSHLYTERATNPQRGQRLAKTLRRMEETEGKGNVCTTSMHLHISIVFTILLDGHLLLRPYIFAVFCNNRWPHKKRVHYTLV